MKPLKDISGQWIPAKQCIQFSWDPDALGADRYIFIVGVMNDGTAWKIDPRCRVAIDLSMAVSGSSAMIQVSGSMGGVSQKLFFGYSASETEGWNEDAILRACAETRAFFLEVMIGKAEVGYQIKQTPVEGAEMVTITLSCNSGIEKDILGYAYSYGGLKILLPFPAIAPGVKEFPPFLVPRGCSVQIMAYDPKFAGNLSIGEKKKSFSLFKK